MKILIFMISSFLACSAAQSVLMSETNILEITNRLPNGSKIGVFIGSFDPLHRSHEQLIEAVLGQQLVDFLIVGANDNMTHKPDASSWAARNSFLTAVYSEHKNVLVADDLNFGFPITGNIVAQVRAVIPNSKIFTVIGNDIATMPHLYEDVPKMVFENGGKIDGWLVNNNRPELNRSTRVPDAIASIPVITFNAGPGLSSSTIRKDDSLLTDSLMINPKVYTVIDVLNLYGTNNFSCRKFL